MYFSATCETVCIVELASISIQTIHFYVYISSWHKLWISSIKYVIMHDKLHLSM